MSTVAAVAELLDILRVADLSERPARTIPENQEAAEEEEDGEDTVEDKREGFIALSAALY